MPTTKQDSPCILFCFIQSVCQENDTICQEVSKSPIFSIFNQSQIKFCHLSLIQGNCDKMGII